MDDILVRIVMPHSCFGVVVRDHYVVMAPPIAHWMLGRPDYVCARWVNQHGGTSEVLGRRHEPHPT